MAVHDPPRDASANSAIVMLVAPAPETDSAGTTRQAVERQQREEGLGNGQRLFGSEHRRPKPLRERCELRCFGHLPMFEHPFAGPQEVKSPAPTPAA